MPVFSAVITSKRARRGRSCEISPTQGSHDRLRLRRKLKEAADSLPESSKPETKQFCSPAKDNRQVKRMSTLQDNGMITPTLNGSSSPNDMSSSASGHDNLPTSPIKTDLPSGVEMSFKRRRSFSSRKRDVDEIVTKHPHKVPIIMERARNEKNLSLLDKSKFLVPEELTMSQLTTIIRRRLQLSDTQAFYLIINRRTMVSASMTLAEVYRTEKDVDGFLYIVYASQEMFG